MKQVSTLPQSESGVCQSHEYIEGTLRRVEKKVDEGFAEVNRTLVELRVALARREESEKGQWREIRTLREKVEDLPGFVGESLADHVRDCPLQDITEVGIKTERRKNGDRGRQETYDTPSNGTRRSRSITPKGKMSTRSMVIIGAGAAAVVAALGVWIGVALATGSAGQATDAVHDLAKTATSAAQQ
ncbi:MAG: hypothetical protein PHR35_14700 [Kiritimatiellae bacterium]|nr:hypothetical protein [Kiritimatiellia bacterium]